MSMADDVHALRAEYRGLVIDWEEAKYTAAQANQFFGQLHQCYKRLRESDAGRQAISGLIDDPITAVRLSAAAHSLAWQPAEPNSERNLRSRKSSTCRTHRATNSLQAFRSRFP